MSNHKKTFFVLLVVFLLFFWREFYLQILRSPQILVDQEILVFVSPSSPPFYFGTGDSPRAQVILRGNSPFFAKSNYINIFASPADQTSTTPPNNNVKKISENFATLSLGKTVFLLLRNNFAKNYSQEVPQILQTSIGLAGDFYVMISNQINEALPCPSKGIIYLGPRSPSKKIKVFSHRCQVALLDTKSLGTLSFTEKKEKLIIKSR